MLSTTKTNFDYALYEAVKINKYTTIKALLAAGANPNGYRDSSTGFSCLHWAVANEDIEVVELLLNAGADISAEEKQHTTPIEAAAALNTINGWEIVKLIAQKRNNIANEKYYGHMMALVLAIAYGHKETARILLEAGTHTHVRIETYCERYDFLRDKMGCNLLHLAIFYRQLDILTMLLAYDAKPFVSKKKVSALDYAATMKDHSYLKAILNYDKTLTGEAIYKEILKGNVTAEAYKRYAPFKEIVFAYILRMSSDQERFTALTNALNKQHSLGQLFWFKRGAVEPMLGCGMLKKIENQLKIEEGKITIKPQQATITTVQPVIQTVVQPVVQPFVPVEQPVFLTVEQTHQYYPTLFQPQPQLEPVYKSTTPTFTNMMREAPDMKEMPPLKKDKIRQPGY